MLMMGVNSSILNILSLIFSSSMLAMTRPPEPEKGETEVASAPTQTAANRIPGLMPSPRQDRGQGRRMSC
jgi:hypothetical protein